MMKLYAYKFDLLLLKSKYWLNWEKAYKLDRWIYIINIILTLT